MTLGAQSGLLCSNALTLLLHEQRKITIKLILFEFYEYLHKLTLD